ncbi:MAG: alpha-mannosidase, partial [Clostridia bacterium]|nr:alpha-mannosidase [Clostridia bacterium]
QAKFEVSNHKYTDISEPSYGVAVLHDCKYGVSVLDSCIALTLHKGGCKPDPRGDKGVHSFTYSFYPHLEALSSKNTIHEGYKLNNPVLSYAGEKHLESLITVEKPNIIIESIKPCEENQNAYIVRMYEAEGSYTSTKINIGKYNSVAKVDMLEMNEQKIDGFCKAEQIFKPFEIKTFKVYY